MAAARQRIVVSRDTRPKLPRHVRLHFEPVRQAWALLSPEKVHWPDETGLAIVRRCDGTRTVGDIAADLARDYDAPFEEVEQDLIAFLQEWTDNRLVSA